MNTFPIDLAAKWKYFWYRIILKTATTIQIWFDFTIFILYTVHKSQIIAKIIKKFIAKKKSIAKILIE